MKTFMVGLCSFFVLSSLFFLFNRLLNQTRQKTSLYDHKSELEDTPMSYAMKSNQAEQSEDGSVWEYTDETE